MFGSIEVITKSDKCIIPYGQCLICRSHSPPISFTDQFQQEGMVSTQPTRYSEYLCVIIILLQMVREEHNRPFSI